MEKSVVHVLMPESFLTRQICLLTSPCLLHVAISINASTNFLNSVFNFSAPLSLSLFQALTCIPTSQLTSLIYILIK